MEHLATSASDQEVLSAKSGVSERLIVNRCRQIMIRDLKRCLECGAC